MIVNFKGISKIFMNEVLWSGLTLDTDISNINRVHFVINTVMYHVLAAHPIKTIRLEVPSSLGAPFAGL
jgi:hypothetical protein